MISWVVKIFFVQFFCVLATSSYSLLQIYIELILGTDTLGFPGGSVIKNPPANAGDIRDTSSIPGSVSCLENAMDRGAWLATVSVQFSRSVMSNSAGPRTAACQASLSITNSQSLIKHVHWVGDAIQPSHPRLSLLLLPSIFSSIMVFSSELDLHIRWPMYWTFSFSISPSNEYSGLISFRMDWFDLLTVQGTLKSLLQHHSSKALILQHSVFFIVQLSHPYMTTGKTTALTRWTIDGKAMSLLFNKLSRLVIAFLPRRKYLLISWLQPPSAVILEPPKIVCHCFHCFPIYLPWGDGIKCHDLHFLNVEF